MLPSETMIWQPEFTDKTFSRKLGAVPFTTCNVVLQGNGLPIPYVDQYNRNDNFRFRAQPKYILGHLSNRLPDTAPFFNKKINHF
ncbi:hypothetical protein CUA52_20815 [Shigella flexneri]|uniref:Orf, hypothetical n=1 Tax=Shigella flexneri serotype 5a (strain M90T) TaxID=1086030 RepID=Q9AG02_SHIFM|nr:orf, hypothetical [Shigella flexneri 5a str. M90T]RIF84676.1 hypothetical protein CUA52_20815 [Shigella flexneri]